MSPSLAEPGQHLHLARDSRPGVFGSHVGRHHACPALGLMTGGNTHGLQSSNGVGIGALNISYSNRFHRPNPCS